MVKWHRVLLASVGTLLLAVWPVRWLAAGLPAGWSATEGGGAWPIHLLAEGLTAALCIWTARTKRDPRPAGLLAMGALLYGAINGLSYGLYGDPWQIGLAVAKLAAGIILIQAVAPLQRAEDRAAPRWPGVVVALLGLGMIAFWTMQLAVESIMAGGLGTAEGDAYLLFHLIAELLAGATAVLGGTALLLRRQAGVSITLIGAGGVLYAAVNSLGWAVLNDAALVVVFIVSILLVLSASVGLTKEAAR